MTANIYLLFANIYSKWLEKRVKYVNVIDIVLVFLSLTLNVLHNFF